MSGTTQRVGGSAASTSVPPTRRAHPRRRRWWLRVDLGTWRPQFSTLLCLLVLAAPSNVEVVIQRRGEGEPLLVPLKLPGSPVRLGFSWDQDRAASSMVMLTRVVPGSAAEQAGLAALDRVYQVNGREFASGTEFGQLVTQAAGPVQLLVERQGVLQTVTIEPFDLFAASAEPAGGTPHTVARPIDDVPRMANSGGL